MFGLTYQKDLNILQEITKRENNKQPVSGGIFGYGRNNKSENVDFKTYKNKQHRLVEDIKRINLEIRSELDDIQRIIDNTSSTKDKLEGKKVKTTLLQTSLNLMKEVSNINTTVKKEKDATDKLNGLVQGEGTANTSGTNVNSIMNAFRNGNGHTIANTPHIPSIPSNSVVIQNFQSTDNNASTNYNANIPPEQPVQRSNLVSVSNIPSEDIPLLEETKEVNPVENIVNNQSAENAEVFVNALGETIVNKPAEDFVELTGINPLMNINYKQSLTNIKNKDNPNIKDYFKYNQELKMGWLVKFDEEKQVEVEGTVLPLEHVYPFKLNLQNRNMISSLNIPYKVILTDSEPSESTKEFYTKRWEYEELEKIK